ncbi:MAG: hypothetical protein RIB03_08575 [Henriciella sp.]|uniref:hypothetical protein n=1 Tax=Henriciella sp. TaxID=1968823 RepID=UPI0032EC0BF6
MRFSMLLTGLAGAGLFLSACASTEPERLEDIETRAMAACPAAVERSNDAGDYSYDLATCECIAGRITTPLWSDADSAYSGDPMPIRDAKAIARAIRQGATLKDGLEAAKSEISVPSANSVNTCFSKY